MNLIIVFFIVAYLVVTLALGMLAKRRSQSNAADYFLADGKVSWFHLGLTIFATWFSTFAFLGGPGFFYKKGVHWYFVSGSFLLLAPFVIWFIGKKLFLAGKSKGFITPADYLADCYQSKLLRVLTAVVCISALVPYMLIQIVGIGKVLEVSTGSFIPYSLGVLLVGFATAFYTFVGGVRAIIWTDIVQGILFLLVLGVGASAVVYFNGGLEPGFREALRAKPEVFSFEGAELTPILNMVLIWTFGIVLLPHLWQRTYMAESRAAFAKSLVLFSILSFFLIMCSMLLGILSIPLVGEIADSDRLTPTLFQNYIPWASPFLVLATFAAGMSTIDSQLLSTSSIVLRDFILPFRKRELSAKAEHNLGRCIVLFFVFLLVILALFPESQGAIIPLASKGTALAFLLLVPLLGSFIKTRNSYAANASVFFGLLSYIIFETDLISLEIVVDLGVSFTVLLIQIAVFILVFAFYEKLLPKFINQKVLQRSGVDL